MDRIYSRKRIKLPIFKFNLKKNGEYSKRNANRMKVIVITIIAITAATVIIKSIEPILEKQCIVRAKSIATKISNEKASVVMKDYKYEDLCTIVKDDAENIKMIKSNIIPVNQITSDVALKIQEELNKVETDDIYIRLGSFTGSKLLAGRGPKVKFKISTIGNVETDLKSEFSSAGINQTLHRVYLEVKCRVVILTPFDEVEEIITNQVLIAEAVIVGNVPNSYYNLEGMKQDNVVDLIE